MPKPSPVELIEFFGQPLWLKRDDLLPDPFSGNKGRKFASLLEDDFPGIETLIGYGSPQSNSLYSLAALAQRRGWQLEFYVDHIASSIYSGEDGNYGGALAMGAQVIEVPERNMAAADFITDVRLRADDGEHCLYVPEGGRCQLARNGVRELGSELVKWAEQQANTSKLPLKVFLPSGTGTTAVFLSEYFYEQQSAIQVVTCPVVGDEDYLRQQFLELVTNTEAHPIIAGGRHAYARLNLSELEIWGQMLRQGVEFELLYDPCGLLVLQSLMRLHPHENWLYLHQGGVRGNVSMLPRYRRKYPQWFENNAWAGKYL